MRLIDADALIEQIKKLRCIDCNSYNRVRCRACQYDDEMADIDSAPTVLELSDNPTNGDVIKAVFPELGAFEKNKNNKSVEIVFNGMWWNAPYKQKEDFEWGGEGD